jgi:hypothetical protein
MLATIAASPLEGFAVEDQTSDVLLPLNLLELLTRPVASSATSLQLRVKVRTKNIMNGRVAARVGKGTPEPSDQRQSAAENHYTHKDDDDADKFATRAVIRKKRIQFGEHINPGGDEYCCDRQ